MEHELRDAVEASRSYSGVLRHLGLRVAGGNFATARRYIARWGISTAHFDGDTAHRFGPRPVRPLDEILVADSNHSRAGVKRRLFGEGVKTRRCELCGQDEIWEGKRMSLILDHINGVWNDNRLENLRIVCPNCNATFETHCGKKNRVPVVAISCAHCGTLFEPKKPRQRYCSRPCGMRWDRRSDPRPATRRVDRPPIDQLRREIAELGWSATGRRYGVSDNAIRKWVRAAEREAALAAP